MPIYEYRCKDCQKKSTVLVRSMTGTHEANCDHCGGGNLTRLISRVSFHRSWGDSLNWAPDSAFPGDTDQEDPQQMAQWMRQMKKEMGDEVTPEFEEMMDEMESEGAGPDYGDDDFDE